MGKREGRSLGPNLAWRSGQKEGEAIVVGERPRWPASLLSDQPMASVEELLLWSGTASRTDFAGFGSLLSGHLPANTLGRSQG